jgi:TRAP-type transport system periplasmic protein
MTKLLKGVATCALMLGLALTSAAARAAEYKLTHSADVQHPNHLAAEEMVKRIDERTKGQVKIKMFPNNALGSPPETTEQVRLGVIEFAILSPTQLDKYNRAFGVVFIPYQFDDFAHAHKTLDQTAAAWLQDMHRKIGFVHIANFEWGFRSITNSKRPINSPDDVKGLKLRVPPEIQIKAAMEALGAVTHTIAFSEVYLALASGTVDGQDNPVPTNYSQKFYEVNKYLALTKHVYTPMMLVANARAWERISPENRKVIEEEGKRAGQKARQDVQDKEKGYIAEMEKAGVQTTEPDVSKFRALMGPAYKAVREWVNDDKAWEQWAGFVEAARKK